MSFPEILDFLRHHSRETRPPYSRPPPRNPSHEASRSNYLPTTRFQVKHNGILFWQQQLIENYEISGRWPVDTQ